MRRGLLARRPCATWASPTPAAGSTTSTSTASTGASTSPTSAPRPTSAPPTSAATPDDYDVIKARDRGYDIEATDGNLDAWSRLWQAATCPGAWRRTPRTCRLQGNNPDGTDNPAYEVLLDVDNLIDYMLVILYGGNLDAPIIRVRQPVPINNFFAMRDRTGREGFQFFMHDAEHTLLNVSEDRNGPFPVGAEFRTFNPQFLHQQLLANAEYRRRFADRVQKHFFNDGVFTPGRRSARFRARASEIDRAILGESARWGDAQRPNAPLTHRDWKAAVDRVTRQYLPARTRIVLDQFRANGLLPSPRPSRLRTPRL